MKIFKFLLFLASFLLLHFSVFAGYSYPLVCSQSKHCFSTETSEINPRESGYFMTNETISEVSNFKSHIDTKISEYIEYYDIERFVIDGFSTEDDGISDKSFTIQELLNVSTHFSITSRLWGRTTIESRYDNGYDYFFENFSDIINRLHFLGGFPRGEKKQELSDMLKNIISYNHQENRFFIRNVCTSLECSESDYLKVRYDFSNKLYVLNGDIKKNSEFIGDTFKVSEDYSVSSVSLQAGGSLKFNFGFEDYLDIDANSTHYKYKISYKYEGEEVAELLEEEIKVASDFSVSSDTIGDEALKEIIDINVLKPNLKKVRLGVKEGLTLTRIGKVYFYLSVTNLNTGDTFEDTLINNVPVKVIPNDTIRSGEAEITGFSDSLKSNIGDTFSVIMSLKDEYGNSHSDMIDGYEIFLSDGSSKSIKLSNQGSSEYSDRLTIKTENDGKNSLYFKFHITESGYHILNGFDIKVRKKQSASSYASPAKFSLFEELVPSNLYNASGQKLKIFIKSSAINDFQITCTNQPITLKAICLSDNFSGCDSARSDKKSFYFESENGSSGSLAIVDEAQNKKFFNYHMNHIDQTAPTITIGRGNLVLNDGIYNYKASEKKLTIQFKEKTTSNCDAEIDYTVSVNEKKIEKKVTDSQAEYIDGTFFSTSGKKILKITATDAYGNSAGEREVEFNIVPKSLDTSKTTITHTNNESDIFANNSDEFNFTVAFKDEFNNPIYKKDLISINQSCGDISDCFTITENMLDRTGADALLENISNKMTNENGEINFTLRSLVPGIFSDLFQVTIPAWDNEYKNTATVIDQYISSGNNYEFLSPIEGELGIDGQEGELPQLGKEQKYNISLKNIGSLGSISNGSLDISKTSLLPISEGNFWESFSIINKNFGSNIDTITSFSGSVDSRGSALSTIDIGATGLGINYTIGGKNISYPLGDFEIKSCEIKTLGLKVKGIIKGDGKSDQTGQVSNISELGQAGLRAKIKKNAYQLIRGVTSGDIINNVKYVEGDITIWGDDFNYETLIVKGGNVFIASDLNTSGDKLGIIVLQDNYNPLTDYDKTGNIYISKDVETIKAILYTDGAIRSAYSNGDSYTDQEISEKKLYLLGSIFSKNTIGGAVTLDSTYVLPGGESTNDFDIASKYDLNYVRKVPFCGDNEDSYSFLIEYNPQIQLDPPKGFSN